MAVFTQYLEKMPSVFTEFSLLCRLAQTSWVCWLQVQLKVRSQWPVSSKSFLRLEWLG